MMKGSKNHKRCSDASSEKPFKMRRKVITLEEKLEVIKRYENSERTCDIGRITGLNEATLRCIRSNAEKIKKSYENSTPIGAKRCNKVRPKIMQVMEKQVVEWINSEIIKNSNVSLLAIKSKALSIFEDLKKDFPNEAKLDFTASSGWFHRFKVRQQLQNIKFNGDCFITDCINSELLQNDTVESTESSNFFSEESSSFVPKKSRTYMQKDIEMYDEVKVNQTEKSNEVYLSGSLNKAILQKNLDQIEEALGNFQKFDNEVKRSSSIIKRVKHLLKPYYDLLQEKLKIETQTSEETDVSCDIYSVPSHETSHDSYVKRTVQSELKDSFGSDESEELILPI